MGTILTPESVVYAILAFAQIITLPIDFMQDRFMFFGSSILLFSANPFYVFRQFYFMFFGQISSSDDISSPGLSLKSARFSARHSDDQILRPNNYFH